MGGCNTTKYTLEPLKSELRVERDPRKVSTMFLEVWPVVRSHKEHTDLELVDRSWVITKIPSMNLRLNFPSVIELDICKLTTTKMLSMNFRFNFPRVIELDMICKLTLYN